MIWTQKDPPEIKQPKKAPQKGKNDSDEGSEELAGSITFGNLSIPLAGDIRMDFFIKVSSGGGGFLLSLALLFLCVCLLSLFCF